MTHEIILNPWQTRLLNRLAEAEKSVMIVSPFIKTPIISQLYKRIRSDINIRAITRFKDGDFLAGASDVDAVYLLSSLRRELSEVRYNNLLHAKLYVIDGKIAYIGSANLTYSGLNRNLELGLETEDRDLIGRLVEEFDRQWDLSSPITEDNFILSVRSMRRSRVLIARVEEEHSYDTSRHAEIFAETAPSNVEVGHPTFIEPDEPLLTEKELLLDQMILEEGGSQEGGGAMDQQNEIMRDKAAQVVDEFLFSIGRLLPVTSISSKTLLAKVLCASASVGLQYRLNEPLICRDSGVDLAEVLSSDVEVASSIGFDLYRSATSLAAAKSGVMSKYGASGTARLVNMCHNRRLAGRQWAQNMLGPLLHGQNSLSSSAYYRAAYRLFGVVAFTDGLEAARRVIEEYFNPVDALGGDADDALAFKDAKTLLQEVAQQVTGLPTYGNYIQEGAEHAGTWSCIVRVGRAIEGHGSGQSKVAAEVDAASQALQKMSQIDGWRRQLALQRQKELMALQAEARKSAMRPARLPDHLRIKVASCFATRGARVDPDYGYLALLDPHTRTQLNAQSDNRALCQIGAGLLAAMLGVEYALREGLSSPGFPGARAVAEPAFAASLNLSAVHQSLSLPLTKNRTYNFDAAQALVAAVALTEGLDVAHERFRPHLTTAIEQARSVPTQVRGGRDANELNLGAFDERLNYVSALQEHIQRVDRSLPTYEVKRSGPDHEPMFAAFASFQGKTGRGNGRSAKAARNNAAYELLKVLTTS